jgi:hypothetical protein
MYCQKFEKAYYKIRFQEIRINRYPVTTIEDFKVANKLQDLCFRTVETRALRVR